MKRLVALTLFVAGCSSQGIKDIKYEFCAEINRITTKRVICHNDGEQLIASGSLEDNGTCPICKREALRGKRFFCRFCGISDPIPVGSWEDNGKCPTCGNIKRFFGGYTKEVGTE